MSVEAYPWALILAPVPYDAACSCGHSLLDHDGAACARRDAGATCRKAKTATGDRGSCGCVGYSAKTTPKPSPTCAQVLVGMANNAHSDGTAAFAKLETLMIYTMLPESTVRSAVQRLAALKIIRPGDPDVVAAHIKRPD